ncbi:hypothetical protein [Burkholderia cepacia]|uniref:hypothetical protein n=1 Tax=Burkholderia cepacia TaxID=292 RepID=UPI001CF5D44F|nr:hypothetical protein [Burkholderia cepacia]MCA8331895.1 hypothetical protein [Burkholderia cepacia]
MATILPNGKTQFIDQNGRPLVAGKVFYYEPGTETFKDTYADLAGTIVNENPVTLDGRGQATICGIGTYRQVTKDKNGSTIWDEEVSELSEGLSESDGSAQVGFIQGGTGAVKRTSQSKMREIVSVFDFATAQQIQAAIEGDTSVDMKAAFALAVTSGAAAVFVPPYAYRLSAQLDIPAGVTLWSVGFVASTSAAPAGARLIFDLGTPVCVVLQGNHGLGACGIRQISILRASGTPPAGSIGLYVNNGYNPIVEDVASIGHAIPVAFDGTSGGISCSPLRLYTGYATDVHMLVNSWPELRPSQCRFGSNGLIDVPCSAYIRFTGGGSGPNTAMFDNCQFNQGESGDNVIGTLLDFVAFGSGQGQIVGQFSFDGCHVEQAQHVVQTDSSVHVLDNLQFINTRFQDNNNLAGSAEFWNLNPATSLQAFKMADCVLTTKSFTLAPGQQMDGVSVTNTKFFKPISVAGVGNSVVNFDACDFNSITLSGSFAAARFTGVASTGVLTNTATGKIELDVENMSNWTPAAAPTLMFGGGSNGITYSQRAAQWRLFGSTVIYQFSISLASKGTSTGVATMAGLPFQISGTFGAGGGGAIPVAANMASMTGPVIAQPAAFATANFLQSASGGYAQLTDANFTNTSNISGELIYPI